LSFWLTLAPMTVTLMAPVQPWLVTLRCMEAACIAMLKVSNVNDWVRDRAALFCVTARASLDDTPSECLARMEDADVHSVLSVALPPTRAFNVEYCVSTHEPRTVTLTPRRRHHRGVIGEGQGG